MLALLLKKKKVKQTKYSKTNNEHAHRGCGFWISSIALLSWISEIREKQTNKQKRKKQKTAKTYTNTSNGTQNLVTFLVILQYLNI